MSQVLLQKDLIIGKKAELDRARQECEQFREIKKRLGKAEEDRMVEVMRTNAKITSK